MSEIGAYEAKTHLPSLLARVEKGERFLITRHGRAVAELAPVGKRDERLVLRAIAELRSLREELARRGVTLADVVQKARTLRGIAHRNHRY